MRNGRHVRRLVIALAAVAACSGSPNTDETARPVTANEANVIANALFRNHDVGSASFDLNAQLEDGATYQMSGQINWSPQSGRADVAAQSTPDSVVTEVVWADDVVAERIPELSRLTQSLGVADADWYSRAANPEGVELDALIRIVGGLASESRENPQLLRQDGARWLRSDVVRGIDVDVFAIGQRSRLWIDSTGQLVRFEGNNSAQTRPVVIDLSDHGEAEVNGPDRDRVIESSTVAELYFSVVPR